MILYKRNITSRIILLWLLLIIGLCSMVYMYIEGLVLNTLLIFGVLVSLSVFKIKGFTLYESGILIETYFCYGFKKKRISIEKGSKIKAEIFVNDSIDNLPETDTPLDLVILIIPFAYKKYALRIKGLRNKTIASINLTKKEFDIIKMAKIVNKYSH